MNDLKASWLESLEKLVERIEPFAYTRGRPNSALPDGRFYVHDDAASWGLSHIFEH